MWRIGCLSLFIIGLVLMIAEKVFGFIGNWWITLLALIVVIVLMPQLKASQGWQKIGKFALVLLFSLIALSSFSLRIMQFRETEKARLTEEYKKSWQNLEVKTNQPSSRIVIFDAGGGEITHSDDQDYTFSLHPGHYVVKAGYLDYETMELDINSDIQSVEVDVPQQSSINISLQSETPKTFTLSEDSSGSGGAYGGYIPRKRHHHH